MFELSPEEQRVARILKQIGKLYVFLREVRHKQAQVRSPRHVCSVADANGLWQSCGRMAGGVLRFLVWPL